MKFNGAHLVLLVVLSLPVWAYTTEEAKEVAELKAHIHRSIVAQADGENYYYIQRVKERFVALAGNGFSKDELREIKYMYLHWAEHTARFLTKKAASATTEKQLNQVINLFGELGSLIKSEEMETLVAASDRVSGSGETRGRLALVLADFGDSHHARSHVEKLGSEKAIKRLGPPPFTKILPYKGARKNKGALWLDEPGMDQYEFTGPDEVRFRGMALKSGDMLVTDLALPHDGLLGGFLTEPEIFSHTAMFLVYRHQGKLIPAILEIHEKGKRLVPLSRWMNPDFTWVARLMRPPHLPADFGERASQAYDGLENIAYDFQARRIPKGGELPKDQKCATCVTLPRIIFERVGIELPYPTTPMHPNAIPNLGILGLGNVKEYYSPTDAFTRSGFEHIGVLDNRQLYPNVLREVVVGRAAVPMSLTYPMSHGVIHPERLPISQHLEMAEVWAAQKKGPVGLAARLIGGFAPGEVPMSAGPRAIGFYLDAGRLTDSVVQDMKSCPHLARAIGVAYPPLSIQKLERNPHVRRAVQDSIEANGAGNWFDMK